MQPFKTVERTRGCWNCSRYLTGDLALRHWDAKAGKLSITRPRAANMLDKVRKLIVKEELGICSAGKPQSDFVEHLYLCDDGWCARQGAGSAPMDASTSELRDILGIPRS